MSLSAVIVDDEQLARDELAFLLKDVGDVDVVAHGFDYGRYRRLFEASPAGRQRYEALYAPERQQVLLRQHLPALGGRILVTPVRHHDAHAYSAVIGPL